MAAAVKKLQKQVLLLMAGTKVTLSEALVAPY
jgi:hypothetical protein